MWKNFLSSIALLAIAMMVALYSSSAANEGHSVAAVVSALTSLILAIGVGIRFVPRLAKSVDWKWIPVLTQYKITKDGWLFLVALVVVVFAAVNTSNNLLYMVLSALLAVFPISGFLSLLNFKYLETELLLPTRCQAGQSFLCSIRVRNHRRVFPMFSVRVEPSAECPLHFGPFYFDAIEPLFDAGLTAETVLPRRGLYRIREVECVSRFPFGLLSTKRRFDVESAILCYPQILPIDQLNLSALDDQGEIERLTRGSGNDLYTIRDYQSSDGARHVHWKASAKTASLKTREYAADESRRIVLTLDRFGTPGDTERFEQLVSQTASMAFHLIQEGTEVALVSDEWQSPEGSPMVLLDSILSYLAIVELSPTAYIPDSRFNQGSLLLSLRQGHG